jgi:phenylpropionate dioxygenase-like ring-hydroxylating dioxygenase large terminal subunit
MSTIDESQFKSSDVKDGFIPKEDYLDPGFAKLEADRMWPYVWQIACRLEEIPHVGDFVTYDIVDDSIIVMRTAEDTIKAYHNTCPHRGRPLTEGCGHVAQFVCRFHGWRFNLDGDNTFVVDRDDWGGTLKDEDIRLAPVRAETWGGFVWINMDMSAQPLALFLAPVIERCDLYEFEKLRYRWYKTVRLDCNWKVVLGAFDETYHLQQTHQQLLDYIEDYSNAKAYGPHGAFWVTNEKTGTPFGLQPSARRGGPPEGADYREYVLGYVKEMNNELRAMVTERTYQASQRLLKEVEASASQEEVLTRWLEFQRSAAEAEGAGWPTQLTPEYVQNSHADWHVFPNTIFLHGGVDGVIWYRVRPDGNNPDSCLLDVWSLERFAPGAEPPLVREYYNDWQDPAADWGRILAQDFQNIPFVHKGMKSRGFKGSLANPIQELSLVNFHRALREFIENSPAGGQQAKTPRLTRVS